MNYLKIKAHSIRIELTLLAPSLNAEIHLDFRNIDNTNVLHLKIKNLFLIVISLKLNYSTKNLIKAYCKHQQSIITFKLLRNIIINAYFFISSRDITGDTVHIIHVQAIFHFLTE